MIIYEDSLLAMEHFFEKSGSDIGCKWIQEEIEAWRNSKCVSQNFKTYEGMSLTDDFLNEQNTKAPKDEKEQVWILNLFFWLREVCHALAQNPEKEISIEKLKKSMGYHKPLFWEFWVWGMDPVKIGEIHSREHKVNNCICTDCGYVDISDSKIHSHVANTLLPKMIFEACKGNYLVGLIDDVLAFKIPHLELVENSYRNAVLKSSKKFALNRVDWGDLCPECSGTYTTLY